MKVPVMKKKILEYLSPPEGGLKGLQEKLNQQEKKSKMPNSYSLDSLFQHKGKIALASTIVFSLIILKPDWLLNRPLFSKESKVDYGIFQEIMDGTLPEESVVLLSVEDQQKELIALNSNNPQVELYWVNTVEK